MVLLFFLRLDNLRSGDYFDTGVIKIQVNNFYQIDVPFEKYTIEKAYAIYDNIEIDLQCNQYGDGHQYNGIWFQYSPNKFIIVPPSGYREYSPRVFHGITYVKNGIIKFANDITQINIRVILKKLYR